MSFAIVVANWAKMTNAAIERIHKFCVVGVAETAVPLTPFHIGFARSNYFWGRSVGGEISNEVSADGAPSIARAHAFAETAETGGVIHFYNNVGYVPGLEFGTANSAPYAMLRQTAAKWPQIVAGAARKAGVL